MDNKGKYVRRRATKSQVLGNIYLRNMFVEPSQYEDSLYGQWEERIKKVHAQEETRLKEWWDRIDEQGRDDMADVLSECSSENDHIRGLMYAVLTVAIWSNMEKFLKRFLGFCTGKEEHYHYQNNKKGFEGLGICIDKCEDHKITNAIRVYNNCFKHNDGRYNGNDPHIDEDTRKYIEDELSYVLTEDCCLNRVIDYAKLPIKDLVAGCHAFCKDLISQIAKWEKNQAQVGGN